MAKYKKKSKKPIKALKAPMDGAVADFLVDLAVNPKLLQEFLATGTVTAANLSAQQVAQVRKFTTLRVTITAADGEPTQATQEFRFIGTLEK